MPINVILPLKKFSGIINAYLYLHTMIAGIISVIIGLILLAVTSQKDEKPAPPKHPLDDYDVIKQETREKDGEEFKAVIFKKKKK